MPSQDPFLFLRRALLVDAVASAGMGLILVLLAPALAPLLSLPLGLIREAGVILLPFAAFVGYLATRSQLSRAGAWSVVALNVVWTLDSIVLLFTGWVAPNGWGYTFIIGQALVVGVFAELQFVGLRKARLVPARSR